jgi:hypothetical protein
MIKVENFEVVEHEVTQNLKKNKSRLSIKCQDT